MADILTSARIVCGLLVLVFPAFSGWYYLFYLLGGFTDAIDGTIARKQGRATARGARFDAAADLLFALAVLVKLVGSLAVPAWLLIWISLIAALKIGNILIGLFRYRRWIAVHSPLNKACGVLAFIPPLFVGSDCAWQAKALVVTFVCLFASLAAVQELVFVCRGKNVD